MAKTQIRSIDDDDCCEKAAMRLIPELLDDLARHLSDAETAQARLHSRLECLCSPSGCGSQGCDQSKPPSSGEIADALTSAIARVRALTDCANEMIARVQV
jgi:hypothetical protein